MVSSLALILLGGVGVRSSYLIILNCNIYPQHHHNTSRTTQVALTTYSQHIPYYLGSFKVSKEAWRLGLFRGPFEMIIMVSSDHTHTVNEYGDNIMTDHPDDDFSRFCRVEGYGDWEQTVGAVPRRRNGTDKASSNKGKDVSVSWEKFYASIIQAKFKDPSAQFRFESWREFYDDDNYTIKEDESDRSWIGQRPADVLWHMCDYIAIYWCWVQDSPDVDGVYNLDECKYIAGQYDEDKYRYYVFKDSEDSDDSETLMTDEEFLPCICEPLQPESGVIDVQAAKQRALKSLEHIPAELREGISKEDMVASIEKDCSLLEDLVQKRGSFGACVLPDALEPIICAKVIHPKDGNFFSMTWATESWCFCFSYLTS